jgi:tape measure domain-containing protein
MALGKLNLKLGIDVSNLEKELGKVERSMARFGGKMQSVGNTLSQSLTFPIIALGGAALKSFADMERLEGGLTAIMGSSKDAAIEMDKLRKVAENPGLALPQVVKASASLQSVGMDADKARNVIEQFGNAVARAQGGPEEFAGIIYGLTQISSSTSILAEDLNIVKERLPELNDILLKTFGTNTAEGLRNLNISNTEFIDVITNQLSVLDRANGGLNNSFDNLKDNINASLAELGKTINETLKLEVVFDNVSKKIHNIQSIRN